MLLPPVDCLTPNPRLQVCSHILNSLSTDPIENTTSNNSLLWHHVFVATETHVLGHGNMFSFPLPSSRWFLLLNYTVIVFQCNQKASFSRIMTEKIESEQKEGVWNTCGIAFCVGGHQYGTCDTWWPPTHNAIPHWWPWCDPILVTLTWSHIHLHKKRSLFSVMCMK
jgi:hypothetical protein